MLRQTWILWVMLLAIAPTFAKDPSTANAVQTDDSSKMLSTKVKSYEEKTNTHRSLRAAADQMQQAAEKDRTQSAPKKIKATAASTIKTSHKSKAALH